MRVLALVLIACGSKEVAPPPPPPKPIDAPVAPSAPIDASVAIDADPANDLAKQLERLGGGGVGGDPFHSKKLPVASIEGSMMWDGKPVDLATTAATVWMSGCRDLKESGGIFFVGATTPNKSIVEIHFERGIAVKRKHTLPAVEHGGRPDVDVSGSPSEADGKSRREDATKGYFIIHEAKGGTVDVELDASFGKYGRVKTRFTQTVPQPRSPCVVY